METLTGFQVIALVWYLLLNLIALFADINGIGLFGKICIKITSLSTLFITCIMIYNLLK